VPTGTSDRGSPRTSSDCARSWRNILILVGSLGERIDTEEVTGSNPVSPTTEGWSLLKGLRPFSASRWWILRAASPLPSGGFATPHPRVRSLRSASPRLTVLEVAASWPRRVQPGSGPELAWRPVVIGQVRLLSCGPEGAPHVGRVERGAARCGEDQVGFMPVLLDLPLDGLALKVSATWRCLQGLADFATLRSSLPTATKHGQDLLDVPVALFTTGPWLPPDPVTFSSRTCTPGLGRVQPTQHRDTDGVWAGVS